VIPLISQIGCYGLVGVAATVIHIGAASTFHNAAHVSPLWANFLAFLTAFGVSYWGNWKWTFSATAGHFKSLPRFFFLSLAGFFANQSLVYLTVVRLQWPFEFSIVLVALTLLAIGFLISRRWAFVPAQASREG